MKQIDEQTYQAQFPPDERLPNSKRDEALRHALDIRKFEIDLYWRRATYFWTFIGAAFVAYGVAQGLELQIRTDLSLAAACLGLVFSVSWYCVNRGSKSWQENWEHHVDHLEDAVMGPLHKTVISTPPAKKLRTRLVTWLVGPGNFSVSKVNQIVSTFVSTLWVILLVHALPQFSLQAAVNWHYVSLLLATVSAIAIIFSLGRTTRKDTKGLATRRDATL